jgi:hypothetical protein
LNLRHLLLPLNAPQSLLLLKNLPQKSQKRQLKNLLLQSRLQKSLQRRKRQGQVIPQSHIILIVDKVNRAQANCDEVSLPEASDSIGKRSTLEEGEIEAKLLPPHINIELTCIRNGKVIGQPDQGIIDPNIAFDALRGRIIDDIEDTVQITESEDVKLAWKWERRLIQQTAVRKQPLPWNKLLRERNWDAVINTLQEANSKKNGTHNMLLKIQATIFLKTEPSEELGDVVINEPSGRVVCASFIFANYRLRHLDPI